MVKQTQLIQEHVKIDAKLYPFPHKRRLRERTHESNHIYSYTTNKAFLAKEHTQKQTRKHTRHRQSRVCADATAVA